MKLYSILFEDHLKGGEYADFIVTSRDKAGDIQGVNVVKIKSILSKLGIPEEEIPYYFTLLTNQMNTEIDESLSQIFAVLDGAKPMWYGSTEVITKTPKELWNKILASLKKLGLKYVNVDNVKLGVLGKPENVKIAVEQLNRLDGNIKNMDAEFHRAMGLALGYPRADVEEFIKNISKLKP